MTSLAAKEATLPLYVLRGKYLAIYSQLNSSLSVHSRDAVNTIYIIKCTFQKLTFIFIRTKMTK